MIYEYKCPKCDNSFDVVKSVKDMDREEKCDCGCPADRQFMPRKIFLSGTKVTHAEYNPAFGKVIKNKRELKYEVDKSGAIEIGNEKPSTVHKHFEREREEKKEKRYEDALKTVREVL